MGRLYWKIFLFILSAQILAMAMISSTFWFYVHHGRSSTIEMKPSASYAVNMAASILQYGGTKALQGFLKGDGWHNKIYVIDKSGQELMGRRVDAKTIEDARHIEQQPTDWPVVREIPSPEGGTYLVFMSAESNSSPADSSSSASRNASAYGGMHPWSLRAWIFPVVMSIVLSLISAAFLAWYFSKPIKTLRSAFKAASAGHLEPTASVMGSRRDELADLGRDFDSMANQLSALMDAQRKLLHDVSHELRSPLARIQAAIGLAHQQPEKTSPLLDRIERESVRMDNLIDELLTLSRLESGTQMASTEEIHLNTLLASIVEDAQFEANGKSCDIVLTGDCSAVIQGQSELIHRAIENVVRNAIKHSGNGDTILLEARTDRANRAFHLSILDSGPGVPPDALSAIFEPFFRAADNQKNLEGHGLGLAIAQRIVKAHGGTIVASNRPAGGLSVSISLPI